MNGSLYTARACGACGAEVMAARRPVLIVFDLDGTLTDSRELARVCYQRVFEQMGFGLISDELAESFNGPDADEVCRVMGVGPERRPEYDRLVGEICEALLGEIGRAFPGTEQMLSRLAPHAHLAILTNGSHGYCETCMRLFGFAPYIGLHSGFVRGVSKAERIGMWARELGAQRVIAVGDRATDVANARAAGAYALAVTYGMGSRDELQGADCLCDTTAQVADRCLELISAL